MLVAFFGFPVKAIIKGLKWTVYFRESRRKQKALIATVSLSIRVQWSDDWPGKEVTTLLLYLCGFVVLRSGRPIYLCH